MLQQQTDATTSVRSVELAAKATMRALLNSYLREIGVIDPRALKLGQRNPLPEPGEAVVIKLPSTGKTITGTLTYYSVIGQHAYGSAFNEVSSDGTLRKLDIHRLISLLLEELSHLEALDKRGAHLNHMKARIENSLRKMSMYIEYEWNQRHSIADKKPDCVRSEQSLYFGHPFHPYPKCSEGFADEELAQYSPEMGASFQLSYFAVRKELVYEEWLDGEAQALPPAVMAHAQQQLGDKVSEYVLVPMHPWQANYVVRLPEVQELMNLSAIIRLGPSGPVVYPTSSVRTVWDPEGGYGYKLPLNVRITNLIRENTREQTKRTMDAANVIHRLQNELNTEHFKIISETGYSRVGFDSVSEDWSSSFTVIYRPLAVPHAATFVMASLLESFPGEEEPKLIQAIRQNDQGRLPDLTYWLECYLHISMLPLLRILAGKGISFEAHLQNSLLTLKNGLPDCYYVRDLEGVSIDRHKAAEAGWIPTLIEDHSPVLYEEAKAWMRTKYYFFVNHLGSLIHTIAAYCREDEERYWGIVNHLLEQEKSGADERLLAYIDDLLYSDVLPAKANFTSCFLSKGEMPLFVNIPNPIKGQA
ncbi:IucA/IucC family protein [Paenibacillus naphthalenovorans]|uniref:IucA/IucC family protein n=1 Tax=Paenibacillus naphthalenovorans TaxID=162209 RepID=UPI0008864441|nr:IucA/IucC family protein [Paenibacillus naphthalenovorans]SDH76709.1 Siderophore synthetase component [Paenibacillus naphthalenovorans]